jgi:hypothetical protein
MSSGGRVESSSDCATRPKGQEIGLTGYAGPTPRSSLIGRYVMATAEHREPCDSRGSCTVLGAPGGEIPPGDSTNSSHLWLIHVFTQPRSNSEIGVFLHDAPSSKPQPFGRCTRSEFNRDRLMAMASQDDAWALEATFPGSILRQSINLANFPPKDEQIHRRDAVGMISKERPPALGWRVSSLGHVLGHAGLCDINAKLDDFSGSAAL